MLEDVQIIARSLHMDVEGMLSVTIDMAVRSCKPLALLSSLTATKNGFVIQTYPGVVLPEPLQAKNISPCWSGLLLCVT